VAPLTIRIIVVPAGVTVLSGLHNPPRSWTCTVGPSLPCFTIAPCVDSMLCLLSHPDSRKLNRSLHTCAQDVQITRTTNNMVNRYNISLNYKLGSLQNDPWVQKKYDRVARKSKCRCVFHRHNQRRGIPSLYLLALAGTLGWTPVFCST
jgi:hypothetical protein